MTSRTRDHTHRKSVRVHDSQRQKMRRIEEASSIRVLVRPQRQILPPCSRLLLLPDAPRNLAQTLELTFTRRKLVRLFMREPSCLADSLMTA